MISDLIKDIASDAVRAENKLLLAENNSLKEYVTTLEQVNKFAITAAQKLKEEKNA